MAVLSIIRVSLRKLKEFVTVMDEKTMYIAPCSVQVQRHEKLKRRVTNSSQRRGNIIPFMLQSKDKWRIIEKDITTVWK